jgi:hypothetical protein
MAADEAGDVALSPAITRGQVEYGRGVAASFGVGDRPCRSACCYMVHAHLAAAGLLFTIAVCRLDPRLPVHRRAPASPRPDGGAGAWG